MFVSKKIVIIASIAVLTIGMVAGFFITNTQIGTAFARDDDDRNSSKVDEETLNSLYQAAFGRPIDESGRKFHLGKDLKQVLRDINNSDERRYYSALFKSVKAYEEAVRAPGDLSSADKQKYLDSIDSALSTLLAWVETLPEQDICKGVVGIIEARQAIQSAYDNMSPEAKAVAQKGIFKALSKIPKDLPLPLRRCVASPSPTPTPTASPSPTPTLTPTPTPTPSPSPSSTPTPTPTPTPSQSPTPTPSPTS